MMMFFVYQIHLNNPEHISGLQDASGVMIWYTPVLRPNDADLMRIASIGVSFMSIYLHGEN